MLIVRIYILKIYKSVYCFIDDEDEDDELFWKLSCVALEKQASLWREEDVMEKLSLDNLQYSTIDGLLLMQVSTPSYLIFIQFCSFTNAR